MVRIPNRVGTVAALAVGVWLLTAEPAQAYVGPGAGFAVGTTIVVFFVAFISAFFSLIFWPFRWAIRAIRGRRAFARARVKRFVILGLDGLEPSLVEKYMAAGQLPNLARLAEKGCYRKLGTTAPPLSPVAWSTFLTGCNPGKHRIFDFLTRDKRTYMPSLSSVQIRGPRRVLKLGKYRIPLGVADVRMLRRGTPFWKTLGDHGIFSNVIRVPITFPPEPLHGVLLSAMCVPDLRGSQGTFSHYTTRGDGTMDDGSPYGGTIGGERIGVKVADGVVRSELIGPENGVRSDAGVMTCPFEVSLKGDGGRLKVSGESYDLKVGTYTPWIKVTFRAGMGIKVSGICQFLLIGTKPEFDLYVTPIQIDPDKPALPISHPQIFSTYLSKKQGPYATLGLAEDTWGLNAHVLDDEAFLHQCNEADAEREVMFFDALEKVRRGMVACVFDGPDRIQHMFWRYIDEQHPAKDRYRGRLCPDAIEAMYRRMDELVGRTMAACDDESTVLMVISDHGFSPFRRGIDLNAWLEKEGYLTVSEGGRGEKYLRGIDWSKTRAFCLGLAGIWLNVKGREANGIVEPTEANALRDEICDKLTGLVDDDKGDPAISRAFNTRRIYAGPYAEDAPDIVVGYHRGYRVSWEAAIGQVTNSVFHDNTRAWSGDHCIDPKLVPGVMFCNRKIESESPRLMDIGATVLEMFGVDVPKRMDGKPMQVADAASNHTERDTRQKVA